MDNASYHHQLNTEFYPEGKTPTNASKGLNAHVLRRAGCTQINIQRGAASMNYQVPEEEPAGWTQHRTGAPGAKAQTTGEEGTVYARSNKKGSGGPSGEELAIATRAWLKVHKPEALDSKVEALFRDKEWKIIWTPPYCPKFQPIELVWGVGKQRAGTLYKAKRTLVATRRHLRRGWYGGKGKDSARFEKCNVRGCWETAEREMNAWIMQDKVYNENGVEGTLKNLVGAERWTRTCGDCLQIDDMEGTGTAEELAEEERARDERQGGGDDLGVQVAAAQLGGADLESSDEQSDDEGGE